jgi:hypothetical protein
VTQTTQSAWASATVTVVPLENGTKPQMQALLRPPEPSKPTAAHLWQHVQMVLAQLATRRKLMSPTCTAIRLLPPQLLVATSIVVSLMTQSVLTMKAHSLVRLASTMTHLREQALLRRTPTRTQSVAPALQQTV